MVAAVELKDYVFGLDRTATNEQNRGKMRFIEEGQPKDTKTLVDRIVGQWYCNYTDRDGNIHATCELQVVQRPMGVTAFVTHPDIEEIEVGESSDTCNIEAADNHDSCFTPTSNAFPQGRFTHWRLCYARELAGNGAEMYWRIRDERTNELWFCAGYEGPMNINWFDGGTHIFVDAEAYIDEETGIARFVRPVTE